MRENARKMTAADQRAARRTDALSKQLIVRAASEILGAKARAR